MSDREPFGPMSSPAAQRERSGRVLYARMRAGVTHISYGLAGMDARLALTIERTSSSRRKPRVPTLLPAGPAWALCAVARTRMSGGSTPIP